MGCLFCSIIIQKYKDIMSTGEQAVPVASKAPIDKKELFADVVAFCSIVSSYFFISLTLHFNIFESQLGLDLKSAATIVVLYLSYAFLVAAFKVVAAAVSLVKKEGGSDFGQWLNNEVSFSLFTVLVVTSLYVLVSSVVRSFTVEEFCHVAVWLWIGEVAKILGALGGRMTGISSLDYFGKSLGGALVAGALLEFVGLGIFTTF